MHHIPHNIEFQMKLLLVFQRNMPSIILIAVVQCIQHSSFLISLVANPRDAQKVLILCAKYKKFIYNVDP